MTGATGAKAAVAAPGLGGWVPGRLARLMAWRRQWLGRYDARTAACFEHAWRRSKRLSSLVEWLRFRRELGLVPELALAAVLRQALGDRQDVTAVQALELLCEAGETGLVQAPDWLRPYAEQSPPIADMLHRQGVPLTAGARQLAGLHALQDTWRHAFATYLASAAGGICVVGNAGSLNGAGLGSEIDAHPRVVRFNRWAGPASSRHDIGSRRDVWVCAPRLLADIGQLPQDLPRWVVLTGPDARYGRAGRAVEWELVLGMLDAGVKVLTFPLPVWGDLVRTVEAPPSAGLSFLAWASGMLGGFDRLAIAGFDIASMRTKGYHHAGGRLRAGRRHAWNSEKALLDAWKNNGLRCLGAVNAVL